MSDMEALEGDEPVDAAAEPAVTREELEADLFGSDDDDDDDGYVAPTHARTTTAADDDDGADAILAASNNLLMGGSKKERKRKEKAERGRGGKRKSKPSADEMAERGLARERKRQKKEARLAAGGSGEPGEEGAAGAGDDDPDSDSVSGEEAIEAGGKKDAFERVMDSLKHRRGKKNLDPKAMMAEVQELQERMEAAYAEDNTAAEQQKPAIHKIAMLQEVEAMLMKKQYHPTLIDCSMLSTLARWLRPLPDGSLVSLTVREALLKALLRIEVEDVIEPLKSSGIGKYVKLLTLHKRETGANKRMAMALIEKWTRPIFQTSDKVRTPTLFSLPPLSLLSPHPPPSPTYIQTGARRGAARRRKTHQLRRGRRRPASGVDGGDRRALARAARDGQPRARATADGDGLHDAPGRVGAGAALEKVCQGLDQGAAAGSDPQWKEEGVEPGGDAVGRGAHARQVCLMMSE